LYSYTEISDGIKSVYQPNVTIMGFSQFNNRKPNSLPQELVGSSKGQDFEPEYATVSEDSKKAWVIVQEKILS
jgi:hypothetical protein